MDTGPGLDDGTCTSTILPYLGMKKLTSPGATSSGSPPSFPVMKERGGFLFLWQAGKRSDTLDQRPHETCKQEDTIGTRSVVDHMFLPAPPDFPFSNLNLSHLMQA